MFDRFNLYDFYGYFVPGALAVVVLAGSVVLGFWLTTGSPPPLPNLELGESVLLLVAAYLAGHLLQSLAISWNVPRGQERDYSELLILGETIPAVTLPWSLRSFFETGTRQHDRYTDTKRQRLQDALHRSFRLEALTDDVPPEQQRTLAKEYFRLAYEQAVARQASPNIAVYNGLYGMYRGFYVLGSLALLLLAGTLLLLAVAGVLRWVRGVEFLTESRFWAIAVALLSVLFLLEVRRAVRWRFSSFAWRFADSVYGSVLCGSVAEGRDRGGSDAVR